MAEARSHENIVEIFARLLTGRSLDDLGLSDVDGRVDLRGITSPSPDAVASRLSKSDAESKSAGDLTFDGVRLEGIDFSGSRLTDLRFFGATVDNCRFDRVRFDDLGLWATKLYRCSFDGAGLRDAVLGGWEDGIGDRYEATSFVGADLRGIVCSVAEFIDVDFSQAELAGIDFDASSFVRCTFAGVLREIMFWRKPPDSEVTTENPMQDVDFGGAELHDVEFRQLSLERVTLPSGDGHVVVRNYRCVLERGMDSLSGTHAFAAVLANQIRWAHPDRKIGIWHRDELGTTDAERNEVADILIELDAECAGNA